MRILVAGGAGFIGSAFTRAVLEGVVAPYSGAEVTVVDKLTYAGNPANLAPVAAADGFRFVVGDICDAGLLRNLVPGHDLVVNFAAETHVDRSLQDASAFARTNTVGVQVLLDACLAAGTPRIVHVSTDEVYGSISAGSWTEDTPLRPSSPYSASKAGGDLIALAYARSHRLPVSVTRCSNTYGPYQYPEKVIPLFTTNLLDGLPVPVYGDGEHIRDWLHVDDHVQGLTLVAERGTPGEVYHIGGGVEMTNRRLTALLLRECGASPGLVRHVADRKGHDRRYSLDCDKLRRLGYLPQVPFETGLARTVRWYREHRGWWEPLKQTARARHEASSEGNTVREGALR